MATATEPLIFEQHLRAEEAAAVRAAARRLALQPDWLMACIAFETAFTFSPSVRNPQSGATGLIQFIHPTAYQMGTSLEALARMTFVQQMAYVEHYFEPYTGRIQSLADCYMAILWPAAVGKPADHVLFDEATGRAYRWNKGLDTNRDGAVTKEEAAQHVTRIYMKGLEQRNQRADAPRPENGRPENGRPENGRPENGRPENGRPTDDTGWPDSPNDTPDPKPGHTPEAVRPAGQTDDEPHEVPFRTDLDDTVERDYTDEQLREARRALSHDRVIRKVKRGGLWAGVTSAGLFLATEIVPHLPMMFGRWGLAAGAVVGAAAYGASAYMTRSDPRDFPRDRSGVGDDLNTPDRPVFVPPHGLINALGLSTRPYPELPPTHPINRFHSMETTPTGSPTHGSLGLKETFDVVDFLEEGGVQAIVSLADGAQPSDALAVIVNGDLRAKGQTAFEGIHLVDDEMDDLTTEEYYRLAQRGIDFMKRLHLAILAAKEQAAAQQAGSGTDASTDTPAAA